MANGGVVICRNDSVAFEPKNQPGEHRTNDAEFFGIIGFAEDNLSERDDVLRWVMHSTHGQLAGCRQDGHAAQKRSVVLWVVD